MSTMHVTCDDPRLEAFANLRDRDLRAGGRMIAEGRWLAQRLVSAGLPKTQVLAAGRFADEFAEFADAGGELFVADDKTLSAVAGFDFHRGVIAASARPKSPSLEQAISQTAPGGTIVVLPDTTNAENLGAIFRTSAALGVEIVLLGEQCCDEFSRRVLRVSMGAALELKLPRSTRLTDDLAVLSDRGYELAATVLDPAAKNLAQYRPTGPTALMFGSEADGLSEHLIAQAHTKLTIPMPPNTNSLNLAAAAAITIWHAQTTSKPTHPACEQEPGQ